VQIRESCIPEFRGRNHAARFAEIQPAGLCLFLQEPDDTAPQGQDPGCPEAFGTRKPSAPQDTGRDVVAGEVFVEQLADFVAQP
jgi:hypothetical protein